MTLTEALSTKTTRLTRDEWNEYAHLELKLPDAWATLRDITPRYEQEILAAALPRDGWQPWAPPEDVERFVSRWPTY